MPGTRYSRRRTDPRRSSGACLTHVTRVDVLIHGAIHGDAVRLCTRCRRRVAKAGDRVYGILGACIARLAHVFIVDVLVHGAVGDIAVRTTARGRRGGADASDQRVRASGGARLTHVTRVDVLVHGAVGNITRRLASRDRISRGVRRSGSARRACGAARVHAIRRRGGRRSGARQSESRGVEARRDRNRGRADVNAGRARSSRNGVHRANGVVLKPVWRRDAPSSHSHDVSAPPDVASPRLFEDRSGHATHEHDAPSQETRSFLPHVSPPPPPLLPPPPP
eukprot:31560-Pelagococcus_subviridis.AAC.2